jgi:HlyD family secretion protein
MKGKILKFLKRKTTIAMMAVGVGVGSYYGFGAGATEEETRYVLAAAQKGTVVVSINGSGQVSGQNQLDIKPSVSGEIIKVMVKPGDEVAAGELLAEIDRKTAVKAVRDAAQSVADSKLSLESAQLSYDKLKGPPEPIQLIQAQNAINQAQRNLDELMEPPDPLDLKQAEADLAAQLENVRLSYDGIMPKIIRDAYDDAVPTLKTVAQDLQKAMYDADSVLGIENANAKMNYRQHLSVLDKSKLDQAEAMYASLKPSVAAYKRLADALPATGAAATDIEGALAEAQRCVNLMEPFLQTVYDALLNSLSNASFSQSTLNSLQSTIQSARSSISSKQSSLIQQSQSIEQSKTSLTNAQLSVTKAQNTLDKLKRGATGREIAAAEEKLQEAKESLAKLRRGTDETDLAIQANSLAQRRSALISAQNKLADVQETLNDYSVRAPFDGIVASVSVQAADQASPSTVIATLLTRAKVAEISLNEVDAAKVKVGQKATLTFDAVQDLTIAGAVSEVDLIGTVAQGVVTYGVKIVFDTQDERIKTGMSVSAAIVTDVKTDVLVVANSAVKQGLDGYTVQILKDAGHDPAGASQGVVSKTAPETRTVQVGLANDQQTEISDGLKEGELVVTRTISQSAVGTATSAATRSGSQATQVRIPGMGGFGR